LPLSAILFSGVVVSAPDEDYLVKGHCPREKIAEPQCIVDLWSRMDEFHAARGIRKSEHPRELKRAAGQASELGIDAFLDGHRNTGLIVLKDDVILAERYQYGRTDQHRFASASVAKTILGMLVGVAVKEKRISSIDDPVEKYVPELKGGVYGDVKIRELLTMSSGVAYREHWQKSGVDGEAVSLFANTLRQKTLGGADTVQFLKKRPYTPGTRFNYSSADSQVLSLVLRAAVKVPLATYLSDKIWRPMGAEANATWIVDKGGYETGYCCINATLRDYARFGLLLANYGVLDGKEIIPSEWVRAATRAEQPHLAVGKASPNNGYGYQTWLISRDHPRFAAIGIGGQAIFVDPQQKLVVVHTAVWADPGDRAERGAQFKLWQHLLEKLSS
jgi:CubicO group peptidase (beta-lactamase class C family)